MLDLVIFVLAAIVIGGLSNSLRHARARAELAWAEARSSQEQAQILADVGRVLGASPSGCHLDPADAGMGRKGTSAVCASRAEFYERCRRVNEG